MFEISWRWRSGELEGLIDSEHVVMLEMKLPCQENEWCSSNLPDVARRVSEPKATAAHIHDLATTTWWLKENGNSDTLACKRSLSRSWG